MCYRGGIQREKHGTKYGALWNTSGTGWDRRPRVTYLDELSAIWEIWMEPRKCSSMDANEDWSLFRRMEWSIVSNAALTSRDTSTVDMPWSIEWKILSSVRSKVVSVELYLRYADWKGLKLVDDLELVLAAVALRSWKCYLGWKWVCNSMGPLYRGHVF